MGTAPHSGTEGSEKNHAPCPVFGKCGGCTLLDQSYERQLQLKQDRMCQLLRPFCRVDPIIGMNGDEGADRAAGLHYRNKVHAVFSRKRDGTILSGTYQEGTHRVVPVDHCLLDDPAADAIIRDIRDLVRSFRVTIYNEDSGYGLLRHVMIRISRSTGQVLAVLVMTSPVFPSSKNFVNALRKMHPEVTSVVLNVNDARTSMVLGDREKILYGPGYIEDELLGLRFRVSARSFYQVNSLQTPVLYQLAVDMAALTGRERVIDAYSGTGTIGIIMAAQMQKKGIKGTGEVLCVELNPDAVRDAKANAARNGISHIRFFRADATQFMQQLAEEGERADVIVMDPPRSGSTSAFMASAISMRPERIVYISCGPESLARDLRYFTAHGYQAVRAVPVDMFAQTEHVECVTLLQKNNRIPDAKIRIDVDLEDYYRIKDQKKN